MRHKMFPVMALAVLLVLFGCSSGQDYSDAVEINTKFVDAMESYLDDINNAEDGAGVADAMDAFGQKIEDLAPEMKAIAEKHPEWKDMGKVPEELKPVQEKVKQMASKIPTTFIKTMKYMNDPQVREAQTRLQASMMKMQ